MNAEELAQLILAPDNAGLTDEHGRAYGAAYSALLELATAQQYGERGARLDPLMLCAISSVPEVRTELENAREAFDTQFQHVAFTVTFLHAIVNAAVKHLNKWSAFYELPDSQ